MDITNEEIFGPVSAVSVFSTESEVIDRANNTPYGLAAYVYTCDNARIWRITEALEYGIVGVNTGVTSTAVAPFGGVKESGLGREGSRMGIEEYLEPNMSVLEEFERSLALVRVLIVIAYIGGSLSDPFALLTTSLAPPLCES